jgi:hypothetical protein
MEATPLAPKKPAIATVIQVVTAIVILFDAISLAALPFAARKIPAPMLVGTAITSLLVLAMSVIVFRGLGEARFRSRKPVSAYLWLMLLLYPICNVLRSYGLYVPQPHYEDNELFGAWIAEMGRYLYYFALIVWAAFSKRLGVWLSGREPK